MKKVREFTYFKDAWEALGLPAEAAENLRIRSHAMIHLREIVKKRRLKQASAAKLLGVSQPRISDLMRGHIEKFSIDALIEMLSRAGYRVHLSLERAA